MFDCSGPDQAGNVAQREADAPPIEPPLSRASPWRIALLTLVVAVAAAAIVTCRFAPRFVLWRGLAIVEDLPAPEPEFDRAGPSLAQLDDPWAPVQNSYHRVIAWRLLFPVLWHYSHLPRSSYMAVPHVGGVLALWVVAWLTYQQLGRWWPTCLATVLFAALPWFFVSSSWLLHFDSWLAIGLLTAAFAPSRWLLAFACLLTPWTDERFVLALPATMAVRAIALRRIEERRWRELLLDVAVVLAVSVPYLTIRAVAWLRGDPNSTAYVKAHWQEVRTVAWTRFGEGLWSGYRVGWLAIGAAIALATRRVGWRWGAAFALVVFGTAVGGLFIAWDMSRSVMMISPAFLLGIWLWDEWRPRTLHGSRPGVLAVLAALALPMLLIANLWVPAYQVLWSRTWEVETLRAEITKWNHPPNLFAAVEHVRQGRLLKEQGKSAEALQSFDAAIRTEGAYPQAFIERAVLRMQTGNLAGANSDVNEALRLLPEYPFALLLRGAFRLDRGERALAAEDFQHALAIAPADWQYREETQRLLGQVTLGPNTKSPN